MLNNNSIISPRLCCYSRAETRKDCVEGARGFPLWRVLWPPCLCAVTVHLVTSRCGRPFPGMQRILGSHPHPHEYLKSSSGTASWSLSWLWETMHNESPFLPPSLPFHKQTQDASLFYLFLDCMPARESTADCIVQQFSRILQSHFISFSCLNPMTLT